MKTETKLEIKCKDVEFQYRSAISEKIQMDILGLKNAIKISISEIKISMIGFNRRLGKNERIVKQKIGQQKAPKEKHGEKKECKSESYEMCITH